ncbi:MAG TPA: hypothetical protein VEV45_03380 [Streptosporangiaceae bacterium]|nr:hypothetical protein [Streptosporangiaceae bacterium]
MGDGFGDGGCDVVDFGAGLVVCVTGCPTTGRVAALGDREGRFVVFVG